MPGEIETAHNFPRDILRGNLSPMFGGVKRNDANRVAVLAGYQVVDGGFEIGLADIGFRKCRAQVPIIVDDEISGLIVAARHNRRNEVPAHPKLQTQRLPAEFMHETEALEPQFNTADRPCGDIGRSLRRRRNALYSGQFISVQSQATTNGGSGGVIQSRVEASLSGARLSERAAGRTPISAS